jgi:hypothetical protein
VLLTYRLRDRPVRFGDYPFPNVEVRGRTADGLVSRTAQFYVES